MAPAHDGFPPRETSLLEQKLDEARSEATALDCAKSVVFTASKSRARAFAGRHHADVDLDKRSTQDEWCSSIFSRGGVDHERMPGSEVSARADVEYKSTPGFDVATRFH